MRCEFCGEEIETAPYLNDGMSFCSLECSDAMDSGEAIPLTDEILIDPDEIEDDDDDEEEFDILDDDDYDGDKDEDGYGIEKDVDEDDFDDSDYR